MAAPVVSGTVALMLQANPALTPNAVKAILQYTAQPYPGYDPLTQGAGFLNAQGAVELARSSAIRRRSPHRHRADWSVRLIWGNQLVSGGQLDAGRERLVPRRDVGRRDDAGWPAPSSGASTRRTGSAWSHGAERRCRRERRLGIGVRRRRLPRAMDASRRCAATMRQRRVGDDASSGAPVDDERTRVVWGTELQRSVVRAGRLGRSHDMSMHRRSGERFSCRARARHGARADRSVVARAAAGGAALRRRRHRGRRGRRWSRSFPRTYPRAGVLFARCSRSRA